jgi:hypothetical protein
MRYTVTWLPSAQNELANIWNQAADRQAVTDASNFIDRWLRRSPTTLAQPDGSDWRFTAPPLQVVYTVSQDDLLVTVHQVLFVG